jgi:site-specific recombinase XerC
VGFTLTAWDYLARYEEYLKVRDKAQRTIYRYREHVQKMLMWLDKDAMDITQVDLDRYKLYMKGRYDGNSLIPMASAINHFFKMTGKDELRISAPTKMVKNVVPLTEEEVRSIFAASYDDPMDYAIMTMLYYGQFRNNELRNLNVRDIDIERMKARINNGKGNKSDEINMHPTAIKAVQRWLQVRPKSKKAGDALFISKEGTRLSKTPLDKRVKRYAVKAGVTKRVYPHLFRHTCISHMADNGATLPEIQRQSRHKDIKTLMVYIHPNEKKARDAYMRTVAGPAIMESDAAKSVQVADAVPVVSIDRELMLLDAVCAGRISEETYKMGLEMLKRSKTIDAPNIYATGH